MSVSRCAMFEAYMLFIHCCNRVKDGGALRDMFHSYSGLDVPEISLSLFVPRRSLHLF